MTGLFSRSAVSITTPMSSKPNSERSWSQAVTSLKSAVHLALGSFAAGRSLADVLSENGDVALVVADDDAVAAEEPPLWALDQLQAALAVNGASIRRLSGVSQARRNEFCIVAACRLIVGSRKSFCSSGTSPRLPNPESLCLVPQVRYLRERTACCSARGRQMAHSVSSTH